MEPPSWPPPNMSDRPPPRPECSRMRKIRISDDDDVDDDQDDVEHRACILRMSAARDGARLGPRSRRSAAPVQRRYWTIRANSSGSREAPPTSAPSMSGSPSARRCCRASRCRRTGSAPRRRRRRRTSVAQRVARIDADRRLGVVGRGGAAGADRPDRLVGDHAAPPTSLGRHAGERGRGPGRRPCSSVSPASRSSSVSPTHTIGVIPCFEHRLDLLVRPSRRSRRTARAARSGRRSRSCTLSLASIAGLHLAGERALVLPVAVLRAERDRDACRPRCSVCTERRSVNGGYTDDVDRRRSRPSSSRYDELLHDLDRLEVVVVHLPVAADERLARRRCHQLVASARCSRSAARPGRSPCSISSSDAPPPVLTRGRPRRRARTARTAAALSPPPTTVKPAAVGDRLGDGARAGRERRDLEHAHRAVPEHRARPRRSTSANVGRGPGTDVEALPAVGDRAAPTMRGLGVGRPISCGDHDVGRDLRPRPVVEQAAARRRPVGLARASRRRAWPCASEERERHRAADEDRVAPVEQRVDDAELVAHLGAAEHGDERALRRRRAAPSSTSTSRASSRPAGARQDARRADDRRVRAVRRAERVVHVDVAELDERWSRTRGRSSSRPGRSAGSRAARRRRARGATSGSTGADDRGRERHVAAEQLARAAPRPAPSSTAGRRRPSGGRGGCTTTTTAPRSRSHSIVGSAARMRRSSVIDAVAHRHVEVGAHAAPAAPSRSAGPRGAGGQRHRRARRRLLRRRTRRGRRGGWSSPTRCRTSRAP